MATCRTSRRRPSCEWLARTRRAADECVHLDANRVHGGQLIDTVCVSEAGNRGAPQSMWRVPVHPLPPSLARRSAQILAMTDVETPQGKHYRIQIRPQPPGQRDPLSVAGDVTDLILPALMGGAL